MNEYGLKIEVPLEYEWKSIKCRNCRNFGHETKDYKKKLQRQASRPRPVTNAIAHPVEPSALQESTKTVSDPKSIKLTGPEQQKSGKDYGEVDPDGLQKPLRPIRVRSTGVKTTTIGNAFITLLNMVEDSCVSKAHEDLDFSLKVNEG